jgi:phosphoserine phosphatase
VAVTLNEGAWLPGVREAIARAIEDGAGRGEGGSPPLAVFDLDYTCIHGDIGYAVFYHQVEHRLFKPRFTAFRRLLLCHDPEGSATWILERLEREEEPDERDALRLRIRDLFGSMRRERGDVESFGWLAGLLLGWRLDEAAGVARLVLERELGAPIGRRVIAREGERAWSVPTGIRVHGEIENLIAVLADRGFDVWIVSATAQPIVEAAASHVGVPPERCIGVRFGSDGGVLAALEGPVTCRQGKVEAIRAIIGRRPVFAAGDGSTDVEMLDDCRGMRLLLDRGRADLVEYGQSRGWTIQPAFPVR